MRKSPKFSPEVIERAVRMVFDAKDQYPSQWAAIESIAPKIGCVPQTLHEWVKQAEVDTGARAGVTTPTFSPSAPIRRISGERMRSLMRGPVSRCGGALWGLRAMVVVLRMVESWRKIVPHARGFNPNCGSYARQACLRCRRAAAWSFHLCLILA